MSEEYGIKFHHRDVNLANSDATSDQVVFDFFNTFNCSNLFIELATLAHAILAFSRSKCDQDGVALEGNDSVGHCIQQHSCSSHSAGILNPDFNGVVIEAIL